MTQIFSCKMVTLRTSRFLTVNTSPYTNTNPSSILQEKQPRHSSRDGHVSYFSFLKSEDYLHRLTRILLACSKQNTLNFGVFMIEPQKTNVVYRLHLDVALIHSCTCLYLGVTYTIIIFG